MRPRGVCLDVMGTLFDLAALRRRLEASGAPPLALEAWFARLLHSAAAVTLTGEFRPFPQLADSSLRSVLAQLELDLDSADYVLAGLAELDPYPEAGPALERLAANGLALVALTNGTEENTRLLLSRAGFDRHIDAIVATEAVGAYKPHRAVYERAVSELGLSSGEVTLIAAHGWDVLGARAAGLRAIWVTRLERRWPLPVAQPPQADDLHAAVDLILTKDSGS